MSAPKVVAIRRNPQRKYGSEGKKVEQNRCGDIGDGNMGSGLAALERGIDRQEKQDSLSGQDNRKK